MSAEAKEIHEKNGFNVGTKIYGTWVSTAGSRGIFIHGTEYLQYRGLIVLFLGLFCYFSVFISVLPHGRGLIVLFSVFISVSPLKIFLPTPLIRCSTGRC